MNIDKLRSDITAARAAYQAAADGTRAAREAASAAVKAASRALSEAIAGDAPPCPSCGGRPHGMARQVEIMKKVYHLFEIGCIPCPANHRALGTTVEKAREAWAAGCAQYVPEPNADKPPAIPKAWGGIAGLGA